MSSNPIPDSELVVERIINAAREVVFAMWSDPLHFRNWAAPVGFTVEHLELDFNVGGVYRVCLRSADGADFWVRGQYRKIVEPEMFSMSLSTENADGTLGRETSLTVRFEEIDASRTRLVLRQAEFPSIDERDGNASGWSSTIDSLVSYLLANPQV